MPVPTPAPFTGWHTSSHSQATTNSECVEVGHSATAIGVRDSKNRAAGTLAFDRQAWSLLVDLLGARSQA